MMRVSKTDRLLIPQHACIGGTIEPKVNKIKYKDFEKLSTVKYGMQLCLIDLDMLKAFWEDWLFNFDSHK